jgi:hypothetical protein
MVLSTSAGRSSSRTVQERPADLVSADIDDGVDDDTEALHLSSLKGKGSKVSSQGKLRCIMVAS